MAYRQILVINEDEADELLLYFRIISEGKHPATKKIVSGANILEQIIGIATIFDKDYTLELYLNGAAEGNLNSKTVAQEETALEALDDQTTITMKVKVGETAKTYYIDPKNFREDIAFNRTNTSVKRYIVKFLNVNIE